MRGYHLVPIDWYSEQARPKAGQLKPFFGSYAEKTADAGAARADPNGFYHGVIVKHGGHHFVLYGPPVQFVPGKVQQPCLFCDSP